MPIKNIDINNKVWS